MASGLSLCGRMKSMKNWNFWVQIFVSAAIPTVLGSALIFALSQFEERLPGWSYNLMLSFIYVVFIVVLVVLVVILIRLAFSDLFTKLRRWQEHRSYHKDRLEIAKDWCNRWIDLFEILLNAKNNDWRVSSEEQNTHRNLRNWFRLNRSKFLPIWDYFRRDRESVAHESADSATSLMYEVFYENHEDPFSYFYSPSTVEEFDGILGYHEDEMSLVLLRLREQLEELIEWIKLK